MKKKEIKSKNKLSNKSIVLILGLIYTLIFILATFSYVDRMNIISNTPVTIANVLSSVWWQILMIILFVTTYILYNKKQILGALFEIIMGMAMLVYIAISTLFVGVNLLVIFIELIYPLILIYHGLTQFKKITKKYKTSTL